MSLAIIPAALSRDLINSTRVLNIVVPFVILEGLGLYLLIENLRKNRYAGSVLLVIMSVLIFVNVLIYLDRLFVHTPKEYSAYWSGGYKSLFKSQFVMDGISDNNKYEQVYITDSYGQPYIYYLFYSQYSPDKYQSEMRVKSNTNLKEIDNITFGPIDWSKFQHYKNVMIIADHKEMPVNNTETEDKGFRMVEEIKSEGNNMVFKVYEGRGAVE